MALPRIVPACGETSGRYGQLVINTVPPRWLPSSMLKYAKDTNIWFNTAVMRDEELQELPDYVYVTTFGDALHGKLHNTDLQNKFLEYISTTNPDADEEPE